MIKSGGELQNGGIYMRSHEASRNFQNPANGTLEFPISARRADRHRFKKS